MILFIFLSFAFTCGSRVFNVVDFGAKGDGVHDDTKAVRGAFHACQQAGSGTVLFPGPGRRYLTGPFNVTSNTRVEAEGAEILGSTVRTDYPVLPGGGSYQALVTGIGVSNFTFHGGLVNGQGEAWWPSDPEVAARDPAVWEAAEQLLFPAPLSGRSSPGRPMLVQFFKSSHITLDSVEFKNPPLWTIHPRQCTDVLIHNVTVDNPIQSPNTDCIDPDSCINVLITGCTLACGDDHVSVKSNRLTGPSHNVTIERTRFLHGQGMTIGSATAGGISDVTFRDNVMIGGLVGMRFKTQRHNGGLIRNIVFERLTFETVAILMEINMQFDHQPYMAPGPFLPSIRQVRMENITGWGVSSAELECLPESPCLDFELVNVHLVFCRDYHCQNIYGRSRNCTHPVPCLQLQGPWLQEQPTLLTLSED